MKQIPYWSFRLLQLTLPRVSRAQALYASQVLDVNFVNSLRTAAKKEPGDSGLRNEVQLTREAFAESVAEIIKKYKLPVERSNLAALLRKDGFNTSDPEFVQKLKEAANSKTDGDAGDKFRDWLVANRKVSADTGEAAKNLINWTRASNGSYKGIFIKLLKDIAHARAGIGGHDAAHIEAELASTYALEAIRQKDQIENSPYIGKYIGWIRNHLNLRGMWHDAPKQTRFKTTLDMPYNEGSGDDGDEEDTFGDQVTEGDVGKVHDLDLNDPDVSDMVDRFTTFIKKNEPEHEEGLFVLLDEVLERRTWSLPSDFVKDDPVFAKNIMETKPGYNAAAWQAKHAGLSETERQEKFNIDARVYTYKYLYPRLINLATKFFAKSDDAELKATLKRWVNEMNESKHKAEALAELAEVPLYEYEETLIKHPTEEKDEEGFLKEKTEKGRRLRRKSSLSAQLLRRVASVDEPEFVAERIAEECSREAGAIRVFERGTPKFAHVMRYEMVGGQPSFDVPYDVDQEHVYETLRIVRSFLASVSVHD
jgi:hypothetical protein